MLSIIRCKFYFCQKLYSGGTEFYFMIVTLLFFHLVNLMNLLICSYGFPNYLQITV